VLSRTGRFLIFAGHPVSYPVPGSRRALLGNNRTYSGWVGFVVFGCVFAALSTALQKHNQTPQTTPG
jgi:hypothetical protein